MEETTITDRLFRLPPRRLLVAAAIPLFIAVAIAGGWFLIKVNAMHDEVLALNKEASIQKIYKLYLRRLAAFERYRLYGDVTDEVRNFADYADKFVPITDVSLARVCAPEIQFARKPPYVFFAARLFVLPNDGLPDVLALSYLGQYKALHRDLAISAVIPSTVSGDHRIDRDSGLATQWLERRNSDGLNAGKVYRPFGYNTGDVDADGRSDFVFGDELYLSSAFKWGDGSFEIAPEQIVRVGRDTIFIDLKGRAILLTLEGDRLLVRDWDEQTSSLVVLSNQTASSKADDSHAPFKLYPLPDLDGDGSDEFAIVQPTTLDIYSIDSAVALKLRWSLQDIDIVSLVGGFADYDGDNNDDFWLAQRSYEKDGELIGRAVLISSSLLNGLKKTDVHLSEASWFELLGSPLPTDVRGIGATVSLQSGDIDGDGQPDFSVSGHRHLSEAGALYIISGKDIERGGAIDVMDNRILKLRGPEFAQLAPPFVHWDAADINGDGFDDIIVSADDDFCSGLGSGAVYFVDGQRFTANWKLIAAKDSLQ